MNVRTHAEPVRLNLFLAQVGVGSRRSCDDVIAAGRVRVDGKVVRAPGMKVVPGVHAITVDGQGIDRPARPVVLLLHKPTGVVSTVSDPQGRPTVIDLCKRHAGRRRLFPVGRLDVNTTGALLVTNDGLLCYRLTHPRFQIPRTYNVRVRGTLTQRGLERMRRMAQSAPRSEAADARSNRDGPGRAGVDVVKELGKVTVLKITLLEGRNRQVRRICEEAGLHVVKLKRLSFGPVSVRGLPVGSVRPLARAEVERLVRATHSGGVENGHREAGKAEHKRDSSVRTRRRPGRSH
jgi:23S rRNA pseudouridine2605 synthase